MPYAGRPGGEVPVFVLEVAVGAVILVGVALLLSRDVPVLEDDEDRPDLGLPTDRPLRSEDLDWLRLRVVGGWWGAVRGYRYRDVDTALDLIQQSLRDTEAKRGARAVRPGATTDTTGKAAADADAPVTEPAPGPEAAPPPVS